MFRKIEDFITDWKEEEQFTIKIFSNIGNKNSMHKTADNIRTLGRLAWHITQTLTEMPKNAGIVEEDPLENKPVPENFDQIISLYKEHSTNLINMLKKKWSDSDLTKIIEIYGQKWEKRKILSVLIRHQIHHRGQMTVLMRIQNLKVPGIYGPSKEEWVKYGMEPQE